MYNIPNKLDISASVNEHIGWNIKHEPKNFCASTPSPIFIRLEISITYNLISYQLLEFFKDI